MTEPPWIGDVAQRRPLKNIEQDQRINGRDDGWCEWVWIAADGLETVC